LELAFSTQELRTLCEAEAAADRRLGAAAGGALRKRLADLRAASNMAEFMKLVGGCATRGRNKDQIEVDLVEGAIVVLGPNHVKTPRTTPRGIDWSQVSRVKILRIGRSDA
jgi:proteic killer suppression protein